MFSFVCKHFKNRLAAVLFFLVLSIGMDASDGFKMILRLWPEHHKNAQLRAELVEALKQYQGFCDEVWLCVEGPHTVSAEQHLQQAKQMGILANDIRKLGIKVSIQVITVGHPEGGQLNPDDLLPWGKMVGMQGQTTSVQSCPRQRAFLEYMEEVFKPYARECQPYGFWLDDDLRLTSHSPAPEVCYCETCIRLFNEKNQSHFTRESLIDALCRNEEEGGLRQRWIAFSQESLAGVAAAVAKGIHQVSPNTHMGQQHVNFHRFLLEGRDWNPIFNAMQRETGLVPLSRPGHGFYNDHAPRGMIEKGLDIARQIVRLNPDITEIAPEIEGYRHKATGKSAKCLGLETMYYLSMGATQMSYAIICSALESMEWYSSHYFKELRDWHDFAADYARINQGLAVGGVDPCISPNHVFRNIHEGESPLAWAQTSSGTAAYELATLGIPFSPDSKQAAVLMIDEAGLPGISDEEFEKLSQQYGMVMDAATFAAFQQRSFAQRLKSQPVPSDCQGTQCYEMPGGHRLAIVESYGTDITSKERSSLLHTFDWASDSKLPVVLESMAQVAVVPRLDKEGKLRSVSLLNVTITPEEHYTLRLRTEGRNVSLKWRKNGEKPVKLKGRQDGKDLIVEVPMLEGWNFGWIEIIAAR